jgi:regulator of protease activity HflC (stomatin/prohibitin superfamily)
MDLERTLTSRDTINSQLRGVLDEATGKWGLRVNRVEIKAIDPPQSSRTRWRSRCGPSATSVRQSWAPKANASLQILTAEGDKQAAVLRAEATGPHRS